MTNVGVQILVPLLMNSQEWFGEADLKHGYLVPLMLEFLDQTIFTYETSFNPSKPSCRYWKDITKDFSEGV